MNPCAGQFLDDHGFVGEAAAAPAVHLRDIGQKHSDGACLEPRLGVGPLLFAPTGLTLHELRLDEATDGRAKHMDLIIRPGRFIRWHRASIGGC